jgi:4-amino-4-deoxy-L-arabinose transferase-like glycosyltransferase
MEIDVNIEMFKGIDIYRKLLVVVLVVFFIMCLINIDREIPNHDEATYYYHGKLILNPELYSLCSVDPQHCDVYPPKIVHTYTDHPPFGKYLVAFVLLINDSVVSGRVFTLLFGVGVILLTYLLGAKLYNRKIGLIAGMLTAVALPVVNLSRVIYADIPMTFFMLLSMILLVYGRKNKKLIVLSGLVAGFAVLIKFTAFVVILPLVFILLYYFLEIKFKDGFEINIRKHKQEVVASIVVFVLIGFVIYNILTLVLYGFFSTEQVWKYQQASGRLAMNSLDVVGFLGILSSSIALFPFVILGALYMLKRRAKRDVIILSGLIPLAGYLFMQGHIGKFFTSSAHYFVPLVPFAAVVVALVSWKLYRRYGKVIGIVLVLLVVGQVIIQAPYYFEYQGAKETMAGYKEGIADLGERVPKEVPMLTTYNGLGLRFVYGWKQTFLIDTWTDDQLRTAVEQNLNKTRFVVLLDARDAKLEGRLTVMKDLCEQEKITDVFYLYKC